MALYMLDTDTVMYLIRGRTPALDERVAAAVPAQLCISAITRGELLCGLSRQMLQGKGAAAPAPASPRETLLERVLKEWSPEWSPDWPRSVPMDQAFSESLRTRMHTALAQLTPSEAMALRRRFGLGTTSPHTLEEVGRQFDITREQLRHGTSHHWSKIVDQFLARVSCLPWDEAAATHFAAVAAQLHRSDEPAGSALGSMDMMVAGHAIAAGAVLVSTHERELDGITGLRVQNWTRRHRTSAA